MGYMLNSLGNLPIDDNISLYIFVVNGGWRGGLYDIIEKNFSNIAQKIGPRAVIAKGFDSEVWSSQVAEKYFGKRHNELFDALPALVLTDAHPNNLNERSFRLIIPLRDVESRFKDWDTFFRSLSKFATDKDPGFLHRFQDAEDIISSGNRIIELKPNFFGLGVNLNALIERLRNK
jgi:hypothetical protein